MASDLISRKAMLERLEKWNTSDCMDKAFYEFTKSRINEQPTVDAAPVAHGKWEFYGYTLTGWKAYECSLCGGKFIYGGGDLFPFCPHCAAKMDGGSDEL